MLQSASVPMCSAVICGCIGCYVACILKSIDVANSENMCHIRDWFPAFSFTILWGSIFLKLRRTYTVANMDASDITKTKSFKRTKSFMGKLETGEAGGSNTELFVQLIGLLMIEAAIETLYHVLESPQINTLPLGPVTPPCFSYAFVHS